MDEASFLVGGLRPSPRDVSYPYWPSLPLAPPLVHPPPMVGIGCPEEGPCFLAEKQLKKSKRIRTRVDAGEPRNPYSAATALASVGSLSSNLCASVATSVVSGAVAAAAGPHIALGGGQLSRYPAPHPSVVQSWWRATNPHHYQQTLQHPMTYCATAGAAVQPLPLVHYIAQPHQPLPHCLVTARQRQGAAAMLSELFGGHKTSSASNGMGILDKLASGGSDAAALLKGPEPDNVLLREILQGRKRDILTLEEIEAARALHQNINNNNSPVYKNSSTVEMTNADSSADETTREHNTSHDSAVEDDDIQCDSGDGADVTDAGDSGSPDSSPESGGDPKKNRLESIVSVMRCSPPPSHVLSGNSINGCKKRKLYLPQQHESRQANDSTMGSSPSGSGSSPPQSPQPPGIKTRKLEARNSQDVHDVEDEATDLQIDLSLRSEARLRGSSSPDLPRASSPKPLASMSGSDCEVPSNYLIDYAKHLLNTRNQQSLHHHHQQQAAAVQELQNSSQDISHKLSLLRSLGGEVGVSAAGLAELESLADLLKTEITASLTVLIDSIVNKFIQQRKLMNKQNESVSAELTYTSSDFSTPRSYKTNISKPNGFNPPTSMAQIRPPTSENNLNGLNLPPHLRSPLCKPPPNLFSTSFPTVSMGQTSPFSSQEPEQDEALSLVVTPKKKRHKVTDSRLTPRTVGRLLEDLPRYPQITPTSGNSSPRYNSPPSPPPPQSSLPPHSLAHNLHHSLQHPHLNPSRPNLFHQPPPPLLPVSLATSVAIPNPSLHETSLLYSGVYYNRGPPSPPDNRREESPVGPHLPPHPHPHPLLHPAFLAASSPDSFSHFLKANDDRGSDCSPADGPPFDQHPLSFYADREFREYREYDQTSVATPEILAI